MIPQPVDFSAPQKALDMRKAGKSYAEIAQALGLAHKGSAHKMVMRMIKADKDKLAETAEEVRELELQRLDEMLAAVWPKAMAGHLLTIDRVLRLMERRSAILGLDAPKKQEISGPNGEPIEIDERLVLTIEERRKRIIELVTSGSAGPEIGPGGTHMLPEPDLATSDGPADSSLAL